MAEDLGEDQYDIFSETTYELPLKTVPKQFKAWHKPRKQYVRLKQWCAFIDAAIPTFRLDGRPLRYLGLPGSELLDIRLIHEHICLKHELEFRFLGFNTALQESKLEQQEYGVSLSEVLSLNFVDNQSKVLPDNFSLLSIDESVAVNAAKDMGPFDIVNIDLCDAFGKEEPGAQVDNAYEAILKLIHLQAGKGTPWILFLTSRVGSEYTHGQTIDRLKICIDNNFDENPDFRDLTLQTLGLSKETLIQSIEDQQGFYSFYATAISKWLICLGLDSQPKWKVELADILTYKVHQAKTFNDMLSAVYIFSPINVQPEDRFGLANARPAVQIPTENQLAMAVPPLVADALNLDDFLRNDADTANEMIQKAAALMKQARYDEQEYLQWGAAQI